MQTFSRITWIMSTLLLLLLAILFASGIISLGFLIIHGSVLIALLAAGIANVLLEKASGIIRYAGIFCTWVGFLILVAALYKFIELKDFWQTGLSLLAAGLACGLSAQITENRALKWIGIISLTAMLIIIIAILLGVNSALFYTAGTIVLTIFSITALLFSIQPRNVTGKQAQ